MPVSKKTAKKAKPAQGSAARPRAERKKPAIHPKTVKAQQRQAEFADAILATMKTGKSLRQSCDAAKVAIGTFLEWVDRDHVLAEHYTRARARLLDVKAEELEEIGELAATAKDPVRVAGLRLQSDNRKWLLSKLAPKKYGDRQIVQGDDEAPAVQIETSELSSTQRATRLASLMALHQRGMKTG